MSVLPNTHTPTADSMIHAKIDSEIERNDPKFTPKNAKSVQHVLYCEIVQDF